MPSKTIASQTVRAGHSRWRRWTYLRLGRRIIIASTIVASLAIIIVGAFPVGMAKSWTERRLSARLGTSVSIGSLSREPFFSFTPTVVVHNLRIAQPLWAGPGDMVREKQLRLQVSLLPALIGRGLQPRSIMAGGLSLALVRDESGRSNWGKKGGGGGALDLSDLSISSGSFTFRDERRHLTLAGTLEATVKTGLVVRAQGRFHDAPINAALTGEAIAGRKPGAPYPFRLKLVSPLLDLEASGQTLGALNTGNMALTLSARAPSLKYLDDIIQAGLFDSQAIDLHARVRHIGDDWFVDRLNGSVGRSRLTGRAAILKRHDRSKVDATLAFSQLDFDDLSDDAGLARAAALRARIGERVLPNTRINLSKVGPTDGTIRFSAAELLFKTPSVFRSLRGTIGLQGKVLRVDDIEVGLTNGRMTGRMLVDHRNGPSPRLDLDLQFRDGRLAALLGKPDQVDAPFGARIALSGRGDTIRAALAQADGHVGFVGGNGQISRVIAAVLAQDMGKVIGAALGNGDEKVPLRCIAIGFEARRGKLSAAPFLIETAASRSQGKGVIDLDGERIALAIGGVAKNPSGLPMIDPVRIDGTLSQPALELSLAGHGTTGMLGAFAKSIGGALGLAARKGPEVVARGPVDCAAISKTLLTIGLPDQR